MPGCGASSEKGSELLSFDGRPQRPDVLLNLVVQGRKVDYSGPPDVRSLLESRGENSLYANVRINGDVLGRRDFENVLIQDGDHIDFLYFMGGGTCLIFLKKK
jgi:sulfur carrier protein